MSDDDDTGTTTTAGATAEDDDGVTAVEVSGQVGTPPCTEPSRRRAMIEWPGGTR